MESCFPKLSNKILNHPESSTRIVFYFKKRDEGGIQTMKDSKAVVGIHSMHESKPFNTMNNSKPPEPLMGICEFGDSVIVTDTMFNPPQGSPNQQLNISANTHREIHQDQIFLEKLNALIYYTEDILKRNSYTMKKSKLQIQLDSEQGK